MIVGNFYAITLVKLFGQYVKIFDASGKEQDMTYSGSEADKMKSSNNSIINPTSQESNNGAYLAFGDGTTPVKRDDYTLDSVVTAYRPIFTQSRLNPEESGSFYSVTRVIENNQESDLTIKEVGMFVSYNTHSFLLARQVLSSPVTLKPGDKRAFVMSLSA